MSNYLEQVDLKGRSDLLQSWTQIAGAQLALPQPMPLRNMDKVTGLPKLEFCAADEKEPAVPETDPVKRMMSEPPRPLKFVPGFVGRGLLTGNPYTDNPYLGSGSGAGSFESWTNYSPKGRWMKPNEYMFAEMKRRHDERNTVEQLAKDTASKFDAVAFPASPFKVLEQSLKEAYEKHGGDHSMFEHFGRTLAVEMSKVGISVRTSREGISFHSEGQELAVEFQLKSKVDPYSRKVHDATVTAKAYDWVTKADVNLDADGIERIVGNMVFDKGAARKDDESIGRMRDGRELCDAVKHASIRLPCWPKGLKESDDSQLKLDLAASFAHVYKKGGMGAVEKLAADINSERYEIGDWGASRNFPIPTQRVPIVIPIVDKSNPGKLSIYRGHEVSKEEARLASVMSADQLNKLKIIKHECVSGFIQLQGDVVVVGLPNRK